MKRTTTAICVLAVLLSACSKGVVDPGTDTPSSVSFAYQGAGAGSFRAEGDPRPGGSPPTQNFATGRRAQSPATLEVHGFAQRDGTTVDWIDLQIPTHAVGTHTIDATTCHWSDKTCAAVFVVLELPQLTGAQARFSCQLESGTVRVGAVSGTRASGEFSGTGSCIENTGAFAEGFRVTGGRFDVKLVGTAGG